MTDLLSFLPFLAAVVLVAASGAVFMPGKWYDTLDKPSWTPPSWLFAPAWSALYILIAIAGWIAWKEEGLGVALAVWGANLIFNAAWSWLMFGRQQIGAALADALAMLVTIVVFIVLVLDSSETAALLFLPYLAWVAFASLLNWSILRRNPEFA
ncbi:MAG: tryptophan-rich sensory protein [Alphaproteobacteria bacterium]|nr:tryptophan-rich sensory protein [Alphaproteobacteria bacterium]